MFVASKVETVLMIIVIPFNPRDFSNYHSAYEAQDSPSIPYKHFMYEAV